MALREIVQKYYAGIKKKRDQLNKYDKAERYLLFYMLRSSEVRRIYKNNKCYLDICKKCTYKNRFK